MQMLIISINNDFIVIEKNGYLLQGATKFEKKMHRFIPFSKCSRNGNNLYVVFP